MRSHFLKRKKERSIILKIIKEDQDNSSDEEDNLNNEYLDLIARKFKKIFFNNKANGKPKKKCKDFSIKNNDSEK